ncbi:MAG: hypothetical protein Q4G24_05190 [Paracoccus sp. (in: a-proteobacteria)]|uniref:hypothetical protein n=1 Tax=Paracoccus sp. TaxID=267 RepID=UPI0026DF7290|nr:hypothetical protein [Paracoccus sp. (in: a-proteobacteria)]MDO5620846.1 hypothetical protein [Paracoccus sp. (in: a-proteobacteria)]
MRLLPALTLALLPLVARAADDHHVAQRDGIRIVHVWTNARPAGAEALIYLEIENRTGHEAVLNGGSLSGQPLEIVGFTYGAAGGNWTPLPALPVAPGTKITLVPNEVALRLPRLPEGLAKGQELTLDISIDNTPITAHAEVMDASATTHSHAGHSH